MLYVLKSYGSLHSKTPFTIDSNGGYFSEVRFLQVELQQKLIRTGGAGRKWKDYWKKDPNFLGFRYLLSISNGVHFRSPIPTDEILTRARP